MKKLVLSLVVIFSFSSLFAYEYKIKTGKQMLGAVVDIKDMTQFNKECVNYLYYIDYTNSENINVYNVNEDFLGHDFLTKIDKGQGFILNANKDCNITVVDPTIEFNGFLYESVISPTTGKIWLDRNLGASNVCSQNRSEFASSLEYEESQGNCFGDYYQWGREADGHQSKTSSTSKVLRSKITGNSAYYVLNSSASTYYDWLKKLSALDIDGTKRLANWKNLNGSSICPKGYRVPNIKELKDEGANIDNFINVLKFPISGYRSGTANKIYGKGIYASLWSTDSEYEKYPIPYHYDENNGNATTGQERAEGRTVRCIKH